MRYVIILIKPLCMYVCTSLPNVTRVRMSGRIEGVAFNITKGLDHAPRPPNAGIVAMLSVYRSPVGFAEDRQMAFQVIDVKNVFFYVFFYFKTFFFYFPNVFD